MGGKSKKLIYRPMFAFLTFASGGDSLPILAHSSVCKLLTQYLPLRGRMWPTFPEGRTPQHRWGAIFGLRQRVTTNWDGCNALHSEMRAAFSAAILGLIRMRGGTGLIISSNCRSC